MILTKFYFLLLTAVYALKVLVAGDQHNEFYDKLATAIETQG